MRIIKYYVPGTQPEPLQTCAAIQALLPSLLNQTKVGKQAVRLIGVSVSSFARDSEQISQAKKQHTTEPREQISLPLKAPNPT